MLYSLESTCRDRWTACRRTSGRRTVIASIVRSPRTGKVSIRPKEGRRVSATEAGMLRAMAEQKAASWLTDALGRIGAKSGWEAYTLFCKGR